MDAGSWGEALEGLARATGSRCGQLLGVGEKAAIPFNHVTNVPIEGLEEFVAINGGDPRVNRRIAVGLRTRELVVLTDADLGTPEELANDPYYRDFLAKWDIPHICQTNLVRQEDLLVGLAVLRSHAEGPIQPHQRAVFEALAPRIMGSVLTRRAIDNAGAQILLGAMEAVSQPVFLFDSFGKVAAMSPGAEALAAGGVHLRLRDRKLGAVVDKDHRRLADAIARASHPAVRPTRRRHTTVALSHADGAEPLIVEVAPFPGEAGALGFAPRALAVVRRPRDGEDRAVQLARDFYGLTQAEAEVGVAIARGVPLAEVSRLRDVSPGTTRNQIKSLFQKLGVKRQLDLARKLEPFLG